jgi:Flp pilus assembly protein TadB
MSENKSTSSGIGFTSLLLVAFIVLKLCNVITWSSWWVLSPAWISVVIAVIGLSVIYVLEKRGDRKLNKISKKNKEALNHLSNLVDEAAKSTSKWQQRLDEVQAAKIKADEFRAQNIN